jgi:yeast amino acid transporter
MSAPEEVGKAGHNSPQAEKLPSEDQGVSAPVAIPEEDWWTRNGLSLRSFRRRDVGSREVVLDRSMTGRHLHMIAIGGSIGAGFFVGSGSALRHGGPGSLLIDFLIIGIMMFNTVYALGEVCNHALC